MKKIGIIIPIYNSEKYIDQCIKSVLAQNVDKEIILVDDGSQDSSGDICDRYAKENTEVKVIHQDNKGKLMSRFIGMCATDAEYVTFVDSDDWLKNGTYKNVINYMDKGIDIISFKIIRYFNESYQVLSDTKYVSKVYLNEEYTNEILPNMIWNRKTNAFGVDPSLCNKVFRRELIFEPLKKAANTIRIGYGDDVAVIYPTLLKANSFCCLDEYNYYHRKREKEIVPDYFEDEFYVERLADLYTYLHDIFSGKQNYMYQLDCFFACSAQYCLKKYKMGTEAELRYLFPYSNIEKGSDIVIYGAGIIGRQYINQIQLLNYCNVVKWVDSSADKIVGEMGIPVSLPATINTVDYDYLVLAIKNEGVVNDIRNKLIQEMHVEEKKIVWSIIEKQ